MKKFIMIMAVASALFSCGQKQDAAATTEASTDSLGGMMTSTDAKSQAIRDHLKAYVANDSVNYAPEIADNVEVFFPEDTTADIKGKKAYTETFLGQHKMWADIKISSLRVMSVTLGNGETWTDVWGIYTAKGRASGNSILVPIHIVHLWDGDKVVKEIHFYDTKVIAVEAAAMAAAAKK